MSADLIVGIDAGTSVIKSVAFTTDGEQVADFAIPNTYDMLPGGGAEQDLERTWTDTAATLRGLAEKVPGLARRTLAIAVTGQGDGTWLIDAAGEPVGRGWLWLDARAAPIVDAFRAGPAGRRHYALTGTGLSACQQSSQLLWMERNRPEMLAAAATGFHCKDWLYFRLTGVRATCPAEGTFTFGDFRTRAYSDETIDSIGLSHLKRLIPPMVDGTKHADRLTAAAAAATGLVEGTPIVLGYIDVACTALGAGLYDRVKDVGCTIVGSTGMHMRLVRKAEDVVLNAECTGYTIALPGGVHTQAQSNMAATLNIDWLVNLARDILAGQDVIRSRSELIAGLDDKVGHAKPGALLFHPYISEAGERGPFIDARARASFVGLAASHGYADLMRAVYEGLALASRDCYASIGGPPDELRLTGGGARSRALRAILAAATGATVRTTTRGETGAAGAAMIATLGLGLYDSLDACVEDWVEPLLGEAEAPDPELQRVYDGLFPTYVAARQALSPVWHGLSSREAADAA